MLAWIPAIIWMAVIYYLSGRTGGELSSLFPFINNFDFGHIIAYFILAALYYRALYKTGRPRPHLLSFLLCLGYGVTDEIHQYFVPGRFPDFHDLLRDLAGAGLALVLIYFLNKEKKHRASSR